MPADQPAPPARREDDDVATGLDDQLGAGVARRAGGPRGLAVGAVDGEVTVGLSPEDLDLADADM
ncbi:hypothetical protein ACFXAZ_33650 [Streptomyces sp. NPDC059477]|uniref:hypothetical protein n=1 Tax=Streptomyces sp. NPDC059477 TaxID=3346847 RepID=UPI0036B367C5